MLVEVKVYDKVKYDPESEKISEIDYAITGYKVIHGGSEAKAIEADMNVDEADPYHEYLVLELKDGGTSTFRNSYVDLFKI